MSDLSAAESPQQARCCAVYQDQSQKNADNSCAARQPEAMLKGQSENGMARTRRYFVRNAIVCERYMSLTGLRPAPFLVDVWREIVQVRQESRDFPDVFRLASRTHFRPCRYNARHAG